LGITRRFVDTLFGVIHCAEQGEGEPVLFLHQAVRSWAEYRHVLPLVGERYRAIAMDTLGFGDSETIASENHSIERYAQAAFGLLDALEIERAHVVGHHTGGVIAIEIAAAAPDRVGRLIVSSTPIVDESFRALGVPHVDHNELAEDGSHLVALWRGRQPFYPPGSPELLQAFIFDALKADDPNAGLRAVCAYRMEDRLPKVRARSFVISAPGDEFAYPHAEPMAQALNAPITEIPNGAFPLPDQLPGAYADAVLGCLAAP
jgi:pimeloyl-ACP methyl ester carboxylesterase